MTALENFLKQIILKKVEGSVYLLPAITDVQIVQALKEEREQGEQYPLLSVSQQRELLIVFIESHHEKHHYSYPVSEIDVNEYLSNL